MLLYGPLWVCATALPSRGLCYHTAPFGAVLLHCPLLGCATSLPPLGLCYCTAPSGLCDFTILKKVIELVSLVM